MNKTNIRFYDKNTENLHKEFAPSVPEDERPQLDKECASIRTFQTIDEIFKFTNFDDNGEVKIEI